MKILVTGSAGFIGFHLSLLFLKKGHKVFGVDNLNSYYDVKLKKKRNSILKKYNNYSFKKINLHNLKTKDNELKKFKPNIVVHLAAQAGVRYSLEAPEAYIDSNIVGTFNILETFKNIRETKHILIASTSSVYGLNEKFPFREDMNTDTPISLYAATKKSVENLSHAYAYNFNKPITILRFFTVYGPWGRPDMALFKFVKNALVNKKIEVFNFGKMERDFTYVGDVVRAIYKLKNCKPNKQKNYYQVVNIGNQKTIKLTKFINSIEKNLKVKINKIFKSMQTGDIKKTLSNSKKLFKLCKFKPQTNYDQGIKNFINWYKTYYKINNQFKNK